MKLYSLIILLLGVSTLLILTACSRYQKLSFEKTLVESVYVERTNDGDYLFSFKPSKEFESYKIYKGNKPNNIDWSTPIASGSKNPLLLTEFDFSDRYFFGIINSKGERIIASERLIPMENALNFRDLGGIPTTDGRVVKWGTFYRSGKLSTLSNRDLDYFKTLGIKTVIDFRDDEEIKKDPNRYPENHIVERIRIPIGDASGNMQRELKKTIKKANPDNFDSELFVADVMRQFVDTFAFQYKPFLEIVATPRKTPLLFHCTAGKDRTGLGSALILLMLGVDQDLILGDYLMSNFYRNNKINKTLRKSTLVGVDQKIAQPLVEVKSSYLAAAFEAMEKKHGSIERFLEVEYDLTPERLIEIRDYYLISNDNNIEGVRKEMAIKGT